MPLGGFDLDVETVAAQEYVGGGEGNPLVAVDEAVIVAERLHQCSRLLFNRVVIAALGTENGSLDCVLIANPVTAAEPVDQQVLHLIHLCDRQISFRQISLRHSLGEALRYLAKRYLANRSSRSRLRATDCSNASITSGRTRCCEGTTLCR